MQQLIGCGSKSCIAEWLNDMAGCGPGVLGDGNHDGPQLVSSGPRTCIAFLRLCTLNPGSVLRSEEQVRDAGSAIPRFQQLFSSHCHRPPPNRESNTSPPDIGTDIVSHRLVVVRSTAMSYINIFYQFGLAPHCIPASLRKISLSPSRLTQFSSLNEAANSSSSSKDFPSK